MNIFFPLAAAVLQATSFTLDKAVLSVRRVSFRAYLGLSFPLIFLIMIGLFLVFGPPFAREALFGVSGLMLLVSIGIAVINNIFYYRALDHDSLGEIQTLDLMTVFSVILVSSVMFADERNFFVLVPALVASFAVLWAHIDHHRLHFAPATRTFLIWAFLAAPVAAALSKQLLLVWHPLSLELVRSGSMAIVVWLLFAREADVSMHCCGRCPTRRAVAGVDQCSHGTFQPIFSI